MSTTRDTDLVRFARDLGEKADLPETHTGDPSVIRQQADVMARGIEAIYAKWLELQGNHGEETS